MHSPQTAIESLEFLWGNYSNLSKQVDIDWMSPETLEMHAERKSLDRPFRIKSWLSRQGYFITAWTLWEFYARNLCESLDIKDCKKPKESTVDWVARLLKSNGKSFANSDWFGSANCIRNLIAHNGTRVDNSRARGLFKRSRLAFATIETSPDGYLALEHEHLADLTCNIEDFIRKTADAVTWPA